MLVKRSVYVQDELLSMFWQEELSSCFTWFKAISCHESLSKFLLYAKFAKCSLPYRNCSGCLIFSFRKSRQPCEAVSQTASPPPRHVLDKIVSQTILSGMSPVQKGNHKKIPACRWDFFDCYRLSLVAKYNLVLRTNSTKHHRPHLAVSLSVWTMKHRCGSKRCEKPSAEEGFVTTASHKLLSIIKDFVLILLSTREPASLVRGIVKATHIAPALKDRHKKTLLFAEFFCAYLLAH